MRDMPVFLNVIVWPGLTDVIEGLNIVTIFSRIRTYKPAWHFCVPCKGSSKCILMYIILMSWVYQSALNIYSDVINKDWTIIELQLVENCLRRRLSPALYSRTVRSRQGNVKWLTAHNDRTIMSITRHNKHIELQIPPMPMRSGSTLNLSAFVMKNFVAVTQSSKAAGNTCSGARR
jgi:hypothetical protein